MILGKTRGSSNPRLSSLFGVKLGFVLSDSKTAIITYGEKRLPRTSPYKVIMGMYFSIKSLKQTLSVILIDEVILNTKIAVAR